MSSNVYTISFVLEKIHHTIDPQFDLRLRFEGHDWCSLGEVWTDDLPIGYSFTTILSSLKNAQMFTVDVGLSSSSSSFLAQLQLPKQSRADVLSSRGLSVLYSDAKGDKVLAITVAVKITKYYHQPTQEFEIVLRQTETQTERIETRTVHTQVRRRCSTTGSNTELHLLSAAELEDTVTNVVAQHLRLSSKPVEHEDLPKPSKDSSRPKSTEQKDVGMSLDEKLGRNLVPRLQKLRVLDKMIGERAALVERFDANIVKQEIARKKARILKSRTVDKLSVAQTAPSSRRIASSGVAPRTTGAAAPTVRAPEENASESTTRSTRHSSRSVESEASENSEGAESSSTETSASTRESASTATESDFLSSLSSSSSKETILRRNSSAFPEHQISSANGTGGGTKETTSGSGRVLSPTSLYLKQLREKILHERMAKI